MITVLVLEDEKKVSELLLQALKGGGYSFIDEPQSGGIIKIVKRGSSQFPLAERIVDSQSLSLAERKGQLYKTTVADIEKTLIEAALGRTEGNQLKAARILGINRNTLRSKVKKLGIEIKKWKGY
jgi:DNA-binding protein Fis